MGSGQIACVQCGQPLGAGIQFCGQCGATQPAAPPPQVQAQASPAPAAPHAASAQPAFGAQTVIQLSPAAPAFRPGNAGNQTPAPAPAAPAPAPAAPNQAPGRGLQQTMVGTPGAIAPGFGGAPSPSASARGGAMPALTQPLTPPTGPGAAGGAMPALTQPLTPPAAAGGAFAHTQLLAPPAAPMNAQTQLLAPGAAPLPALTQPLTPPPGAGSLNRTMLGGVAAHGVGPTAPGDPEITATAPVPQPGRPPPRRHAETLPLNVQYVPPPDPLQDLPLPAPPRIVRKKGGFPVAAVALVMGLLVLVGGVVLALFWKGAPPITGQPRATPEGRDVLHLKCDPKSCQDGTAVVLDGARATFALGEADLPLATPLHVGDNELKLQVDRPGMGRDETVKLVVPVAYRVSADVSTMSAPRPSITVRVEAQPGADVSVDDKPVTLDASGAGTYAVDELAPTEGPADESRVVSVDVPYAVTTKGRTDKGTVSARVAVAPLRVDAPGVRATVDEDKVLIAGRAAKGSSVTVDGNPVTLGADGSFSATVPLAAPGDRTVDVRAWTTGQTPMTPRTVHVTVTRVASLADAARAFEQQKVVGYDAAMADLANKTGQPIVVDGVVVESRASGHKTLVLVDDRRGCAKSPCLTRVVIGRDLGLAHGDGLRAYGTVARAFTTPTGQTVPEVEAAFAIRSKR